MKIAEEWQAKQGGNPRNGLGRYGKEEVGCGMKLEDGSGTMKMEAGICIHLSYKVKMLWVIISALVFVCPGLIFWFLGFISRKEILAINTKKKLIIWLSYISVALGLIALCAEAFVSPGDSVNVKLVLNDPCPMLDGWRKAVLLQAKEPTAMGMAMFFRVISFGMSCVLVGLQILDKLNHNMPVGWALWASFLSSYLMLGGASVELYYVAACTLSLKTIVHSVLSLLSAFSSMLSIHLELVSVDPNQEIQKRNMISKVCEISRHLARMKRLDSQNKRSSTDIRRLKNKISQLEFDVKKKEAMIATLNFEKSEALQKYSTCNGNKIRSDVDALAERSRAAEAIASLREIVAEKESKIAEMNAASSGESAKLRGELEDVKSKNEKEENWQEFTKSFLTELEVTVGNVERAEVELAELRSQLDSERSSKSQLVNAKDAELAASRGQISRLESEFALYKIRAHSLLQRKDAELAAARRKDAELAAARDTEQLKELEEPLKVNAHTSTHDRVLRMPTEEPKAAAKVAKIKRVTAKIKRMVTEQPKIYLLEDGDEFEEFAIDQETDGKDEGKEVRQQWEDDWDDDDDNDFSLQLRRELESNNNDKK